MDKPVYISGTLFAFSEIFATASLAHADWIHSDDSEVFFALGLTSQCQKMYLREKACFAPSLPVEWIAALLCLVCGILTLAMTCGLVLVSKWRRYALLYAKWSAFTAVAFLSGVGVLFPIGFRQAVVGGEAYKLPDSWSLGSSYNYFWIFALVLSCLGLAILLLPIRLWIVNR